MNDTRFGLNRIYNPIVVDNPVSYYVYVLEFTPLIYTQVDRFADSTFSGIDNATRQFGRHTVKAGIEIRRVQMNNTTSLEAENTLIYLNEQAFAASQVAQATLNAPLPVTGLRKTMDFGYVQDEIKVKLNLTITAGLRYDFFSNFHEVNNKALVFDPYSCGAQGYCAKGADFYFPRLNDLGPRLSIAWAPAAYHGNTVVNAGFGRYYGEGQLGDLNAPTANIATRITLDQSNSPGLSYPVTPYVSEALSSVVTPRGLERNRKDAAINEWISFFSNIWAEERSSNSDIWAARATIFLPGPTSTPSIPPPASVLSRCPVYRTTSPPTRTQISMRSRRKSAETSAADFFSPQTTSGLAPWMMER